MTRRNDRAAIADEAWRHLFDFIIATADHRNRVLEELGLTPNDSRALGSLDPHRARTMRSLADEWGCDASTATWIVDRLERRGLVRRGESPNDRRVTLVLLTPRGVKTKAEMLRGIYTPPPELMSLDAPTLAALRDALAKLPARGVSGPRPRRGTPART